MKNFMSDSFRNTSLIIIIGIICLTIGPLIIYAVLLEGTLSHFNFQQALAQQQFPPKNNNTTKNYQGAHLLAQASGHFANNQIKDGVVTWIQGGMWNLQIKSLPSNITNNNTMG